VAAGLDALPYCHLSVSEALKIIDNVTFTAADVPFLLGAARQITAQPDHPCRSLARFLEGKCSVLVTQAEKDEAAATGAAAAVRLAAAEGLTLEPSDNAAGFKGVTKKGTFRAIFGEDGYLGYFGTPQEASLAYARGKRSAEADPAAKKAKKAAKQAAKATPAAKAKKAEPKPWEMNLW
jgi:hypothetical protein